MGFCNAFDEHLSTAGPAAIFLRDHEGLYRFDASWTRDAWQRNPGPHPLETVFVLVRDHDTGFVARLLVSSPTLLPTHPRGDVKAFGSEEDANAFLATLGALAVSAEAW